MGYKFNSSLILSKFSGVRRLINTFIYYIIPPPKNVVLGLSFGEELSGNLFPCEYGLYGLFKKFSLNFG